MAGSSPTRRKAHPICKDSSRAVGGRFETLINDRRRYWTEHENWLSKVWESGKKPSATEGSVGNPFNHRARLKKCLENRVERFANEFAKRVGPAGLGLVVLEVRGVGYFESGHRRMLPFRPQSSCCPVPSHYLRFRIESDGIMVGLLGLLFLVTGPGLAQTESGIISEGLSRCRRAFTEEAKEEAFQKVTGRTKTVLCAENP
jgi:hypothetical protein